MNTIEVIKKELEDAKREYNRYVEKSERLIQLKKKLVAEEYAGEIKDLEGREKELKNIIEYQRSQRKKLRDFLMQMTIEKRGTIYQKQHKNM